MRLKGFFVWVLLALAWAGLSTAKWGWAGEKALCFPSYGAGPVEVRLYSDYFCSPCREMTPTAVPLLMGLVKNNAIRLILVDVPFSQLTPLYARNFLYAIRKNNDLDHAFRIRNVLQNAAARKDVKVQEQIEALFKEKGIAVSEWDPRPVFDRYNDLIREDKIQATPTCVVIKDGKKKVYEGDQEIIHALRDLP